MSEADSVSADIMRRIFINNEMDVAVARLQAREAAKELGFGTVDQARISLATSELARTMSAAALERGEVRVLRLQHGTRRGLQVEYLLAASSGSPRFTMPDLIGVRHLMDECSVSNDAATGTSVSLIKWQAV